MAAVHVKAGQRPFVRYTRQAAAVPARAAERRIGMESRETLRLLQSRKSMRVYEKREVPEEVKREILSASIRAASAGNMALYTIIDITDEKLKQQLSVTCDHQPFIADAPLVLIYCADYRRWYRAFCEAVEEVRHPSYGDFMLAAEDAVIATQTAATAADALGLGTCYIGDILENYEEHRRILSLPDYVAPIAMLVGGYPTQQQKERRQTPRFSVDDLVHENGYDLEKSGRMPDMLRERDDWSDNYAQHVKAFCERKYNSAFSVEMSRSVKAMLDAWVNAGTEEKI